MVNAHSSDSSCSGCVLITENAEVEKNYYYQLLIKFGIALLAGLVLMSIHLMQLLPPLTTSLGQSVGLLMATLTLVLMLYTGSDIYWGALRALRCHIANMDTLVAMGTFAAWFVSLIVVLIPQIFPEDHRELYFESSLMIIAFVKLGAAFEVRSRRKTRRIIESWSRLQPKMARVIREGEEFDLAVEDVYVGDVLHVRPGEQIPVDGLLLEGASFVDESLLTGESVPCEKNPGDKVMSGTLNTNGAFKYRALHVGKDTALAQVIELVSQAQNTKLPLARLADTIASYFVPLVLVIAILSSLLWFNFGPEPRFMYMILIPAAVLLIACPCAIGLATPISVMEGVGRAAESGIIVTNPEAFGKVKTLTRIVFDKTGTITEGRPSVSAIYAQSGWHENQVLQYAATLERDSEHPVAMAVLQEAERRELALFPQERFNAIPGYGLSSVISGKPVLIGNVRLMRERNIVLDALLTLINEGEATATERYSAASQSILYLAIDSKAVGALVISDKIKSDSKDAIARLKAMGLKVMLLSGDQEKTVRHVAKQVGIEEVIGDVLPHDKLHKITQLKIQGERVAMVGDGINDAAALAEADVGFAMGSGADIAKESGDIVLLNSSLSSLLEALKIAKATDNNIKENLVGAFIYNTLSIPVAAGLLYPVAHILLSPMMAGFAMVLSSITVVLNAGRLRFIK